MINDNNNKNNDNNNDNVFNQSDNKFKSKKLNPPPKRPGVKYINAEDEDQMVGFLCLMIWYSLFKIGLFFFLARKFMAFHRTRLKHL